MLRVAHNDVLVPVRRLLSILLWLGVAGTMVELLLLAHYEDVTQWIPLVLMAITLLVLAWHAARPGRVAAAALRATMTLFVIAGIAGIWLHYHGAREFQVEVDPSLAGAPLVWKVMRAKAPPVLAPGVLVGLGLVGFAYAQCTRRME